MAANRNCPTGVVNSATHLEKKLGFNSELFFMLDMVERLELAGQGWLIIDSELFFMLDMVERLELAGKMLAHENLAFTMQLQRE